jgi:hypothetical protein
MNRDFEVVQSKRNISSVEHPDVTISSLSESARMSDAISDNFHHILDLASGIVEIEKIKVQSEAVLKHMEASRQQLLSEAEAYAKKKSADTESVVQKMQMVRDMMRDFYQYNNNANLSGEDFSRIISSIVSEMGRL